MRNVSESEKKLGYNIHAFVFVLMMAILAAVNAMIGPPWWVQWALLGWGIGLLSHWWFVLGPGAGAR